MGIVSPVLMHGVGPATPTRFWSSYTHCLKKKKSSRATQVQIGRVGKRKEND